MIEEGSTRAAPDRPRGAGPQLLLELHRGAGPLRAQLEAGLRAAIRDGRLAAGARLPSSRALARDLGVSRRLVVEAYEQLVAEGFLAARHGSGTVVADGGRPPCPPRRPPRPRRRPRAYDFFPGVADLAAFPRAAWLRATRAVLRERPGRGARLPRPARGARAARRRSPPTSAARAASWPTRARSSSAPA